jgi:hypothetical protein
MVFAAFLVAPTKVFVAFLALRVTFFDAADIFLRVSRFLNALNAFIGLYSNQSQPLFLRRAYKQSVQVYSEMPFLRASV